MEEHIPEPLPDILSNKGIRSLYPVQVKAIKAGLFEGRNLVVSAPTASGKTLIAIMGIIYKVLKNKVKALYLTPLRALASEKYEELEDFTKDLGLRVALTTGDYDSDDPWL
ncbi:MAG TPA: DEAD/DEAH box helicase, partial [Thermoproteales archaeon]|nr:DEAD/DEAH box helicase [Thermoproteales archaeon]